MDSAAEFLFALCDGGCNGEAVELLNYNMRSLAATYVVAVVFRRMLETLFEDQFEYPDGMMRDRADAMEKTEMEKMFESLIPNNQVRARIFNRCLWGMSTETFERRNVEESTGVDEDADAVAGLYSVEAENQLDVDDDLQPARAGEPGRTGEPERMSGLGRPHGGASRRNHFPRTDVQSSNSGGRGLEGDAEEDDMIDDSTRYEYEDGYDDVDDEVGGEDNA